MATVKIVAISDTHGLHEKLTIPPCDILLSAGDYSFLGSEKEIKAFHRWMSLQPAKHKISVQGNHEIGIEKNFLASKALAEANCPGVHFVEEGPLELEGIKFWLSAIQPTFHNWAYNRARGSEIKNIGR